MTHSRLIPTLIVLFILFGLATLVTHAPIWRSIFAGLSTLSLGTIGLLVVADAKHKGQLRMHGEMIYRHDTPRLFRLMTTVIALAGVLAVAIGFLLVFRLV